MRTFTKPTSKGMDNRSRPTNWLKIFHLSHSRPWMAFWLGISDLIGLFLAGLLAVLLRVLIGGFINPSFYWSLIPLEILFVSIYVWRGLYPGVGLSPVEELKRLSVSTSVVFLVITAVTFWIRTAEYYSRLVFAFAWIFALIILPINRAIIRSIAVRLGLWGEPVAVVGYGPQGQKIVDFLCENLRFGLRPVALVSASNSSVLNNCALPRFSFDNNGDISSKLTNVRTLVLITSEMHEELQDAIVDQHRFGFKRLILIPNLHWVGSVGVIPYDLEGFLGLEVRQNLLKEWEQSLKRVLDVGMVFGLGVFALPIFWIIALVIKLDSKGNSLYSQRRIGKGGRKFNMLKFRTMVTDADQALIDHFSENQTARAEWEASQKLKEDPRVTRVGKFLRKTSLDELPQLWNVLKGEMSLVGPRPIVEEEIKLYRDGYRLYHQVRPGITGLWQVSGRNDVGYDRRVRYDEYYVRNWSIWLDVYILLRTIWTVAQGEGAY
jgi:Undecaprenyl-phosphate galactose phosphotransferase WbaP